MYAEVLFEDERSKYTLVAVWPRRIPYFHRSDWESETANLAVLYTLLVKESILRFFEQSSGREEHGQMELRVSLLSGARKVEKN